LRARKKSGDLTTAIVPAGISFPAVLREPLDLLIARYAATSFFEMVGAKGLGDEALTNAAIASGSDSITPSRTTDPTWFTTQIDVRFNDTSSPT
jgi:hypothetical protein